MAEKEILVFNGSLQSWLMDEICTKMLLTNSLYDVVAVKLYQQRSSVVWFEEP